MHFKKIPNTTKANKYYTKPSMKGEQYDTAQASCTITVWWVCSYIDVSVVIDESVTFCLLQ